MNKKFIVANWKSNKVRLEVDEWIRAFNFSAENQDKTVIICPSYVYLPRLRQAVNEGKLNVSLGAQDVSPSGFGPYTGEVNAMQIKDYAGYVIIGHSERRSQFHEDQEILSRKTERAFDAGLAPIFCVQGKNDEVPSGVSIVAYEPVFAIGTGNADTPQNAQAVAHFIKKDNPQVQRVLYGGSITSENVKLFANQSDLDGVLVGKASLDPIEFGKIVDSF